MTTIPTLILASSSRYRRALLERLDIPFHAESPEIDESPLPNETPVQTAMRLAEMKARAIQAKYPSHVVIGSDQVADLHGEKLGKPHTRDRAIAQLLRMQGNEIVFYSAVCVLDAQGNAQNFVSPTTIEMKTLSQATIEAYVDREKPFDCAGSAKIECLGIALMQSVKSDDPTSLIGLPLMKLTSALAKAGIEVIPGIE